MAGSNGPPPDGPLKAQLWKEFGAPAHQRLQACRRSQAFNIKHKRSKPGDSGKHTSAIRAACLMLGIDSDLGDPAADEGYYVVGDYTEDLIYRFKQKFFVWDESRQSAPDKVCGVWTMGWLDQAILAKEQGSHEEAQQSSDRAAPGRKSLARASPLVAYRVMQMRQP